jgi:hypothetical protein
LREKQQSCFHAKTEVSIRPVERVAGRGLKGSDSQTWIHTDLFRVISFEDE